MMKNWISFKMTHWQDEYVRKVPKKVRARQTWGVSGPMPGVRAAPYSERIVDSLRSIPLPFAACYC